MLYLKLTTLKLRTGHLVMLRVYFLVKLLVYRLPIKVVYLDLELVLLLEVLVPLVQVTNRFLLLTVYLFQVTQMQWVVLLRVTTVLQDSLI